MQSQTLNNHDLPNAADNYVLSNLQPAQAVGAGWAHNIALLTNGTVVAWGENLFGQTNVPIGLSNVTAIAAGAQHNLALSNGCVIAWGYNGSGQTSVPAGLSDVVAIAAGDENSIALTSNGNVIVWGSTNYGQTNVPAGVNGNAMGIAAGAGHCVALLNNGTVMAWGDNANGQTTIPNVLPTLATNFSTNTSPPGINTNVTTILAPTCKLIAAGGNHTMAAIFSSWVQYPVNVAKDLLLIYNTNSIDSSNVCYYYLTHRPMVGNATCLGIGCTTNETIAPSAYTNVIAAQVQQWLTNNPTKRPQFIILFPDIPSRINTDLGPPYTNIFSNEVPNVQYQLNSSCWTNWSPFVTAINMNGTGGTNDCISNINKIASFAAYSPGQLIISAHRGGYPNTNYYFDDTRYPYPPPPPPPAADAQAGILTVNPAASVTYSNASPDIGLVDHITNGAYVAGYLCWGQHMVS